MGTPLHALSVSYRLALSCVSLRSHTNLIYSFFGWGELLLGLEPLTGALSIAGWWMSTERWWNGKWRSKTQVLEQNPVALPLFPPQIAHGLPREHPGSLTWEASSLSKADPSIHVICYHYGTLIGIVHGLIKILLLNYTKVIASVSISKTGKKTNQTIKWSHSLSVCTTAIQTGVCIHVYTRIFFWLHRFRYIHVYRRSAVTQTKLWGWERRPK